MPAEVVVIGGTGLIGAEVVRAARSAGLDVLAPSRAEVELTDPRSIERLFGRVRPWGVINAAALADVDGCEREPERAAAINTDGAGALARACTQAGARLLHLSTDYVYGGGPVPRDGMTPRGYREDDPTAPVGVYGRTKLAGDEQVLAAGDHHLVVRTAWVSGMAGGFVPTILEVARAHERDPARGPVRVVDDQSGSPTVASELAAALVSVLRSDVAGVLHLAGADHGTWLDVARSVVAAARVSVEVEGQPGAALDRPAPRPAWSVLDSGLARRRGWGLRPWPETVAALTRELAGT